MFNQSLNDFQLLSLKQDVAKDIREVSNYLENIFSFLRNATSTMREIESSRSSLDRAMDEKIRNLQSSTRKTSSYSSFSSSAADYRIRDAKMNLDRGVSKLVNEIRMIAQRYDSAKRAEKDMEENFRIITDAYRNLGKQLTDVTKGNERIRRNIDSLSREKDDIERKSVAKEHAMRSELTKANHRAEIAGKTAVVAAAAALQSESMVSANRQIEAERRAFEKQISDLKRTYEQEIVALKKAIAQDDTEVSSADSQIMDSDEQVAEHLKHVSVNEYAELWNKILDDDIVEIQEVKEIKHWIENNYCSVPEFTELANCCDSILIRGEVLPKDVQALYDYSFRFLKALGANINDEGTTKEVLDIKRRGPFRFSKCGIEVGEEIVFVNDESIKAVVVDDRHVRFANKRTSLSALAKQLLGNTHSVQGTLYFRYKGKVLDDIRKECEANLL